LVGDPTFAIIIFLSSTVSSDVEIVVVAPFTVKSPVINTSPLTSRVTAGALLKIPTRSFKLLTVIASTKPPEFLTFSKKSCPELLLTI
jgi:hypothetical protein